MVVSCLSTTYDETWTNETDSQWSTYEILIPQNWKTKEQNLYV